MCFLLSGSLCYCKGCGEAERYGVLVIFKLKTWYKNYGNQGSARAYLDFRMETDNIDFRDRVQNAIQDALGQKPPAKDQKPSAMGFQAYGPEDG